MKKVVQDLTSGGEDCFPKYTKQFLKHYYNTNEIFLEERAESAKKAEAEDVLKKLLASGVSADEILAKLK